MNTKFFFLLILITVSSVHVESKRLAASQPFRMEVFKNKHWLNQWNWFKIVPLQAILQRNPQITYIKIVDQIPFDYPEFSIAPKFPHKGYFEELFILSIPNGRVQGMCGHVFIDGRLSDEMARGHRFECLVDIPKIQEQNVRKVSGRVAVIAQHGAGGKWANYYHAICEVFGRLALLEISGIEYDWLYVPLDKKYVQEALQLWGVDFSKIIAPADEQFCLQADELIVPSMVINTSAGHAHAGNFQHPVTLKYLREKLLTTAQKNINFLKFSKRVFISRSDSTRKILNEDQIFNLLKKHGFEFYELTKMSLVDQISLLYNAEIVVSEHGANLTNIIFCQSGTKIVEIFQSYIDFSYWYLSQLLSLNYISLKTVSVDTDYYADWRLRNMGYYFTNNVLQTNVPLDEIKKFVETL
jgi:hypothetical protein